MSTHITPRTLTRAARAAPVPILLAGGATLIALAGAVIALAPVRRGAPDKGRSKADRDDNAVIARAVTINRPREELYAFWRDFSNLPKFMENIDSITVADDKRSHWVVKAPAGKTVEWDAILIKEEPGRLLVWESGPGADIKNGGQVEFKDAPGGRGTEVHATIVYEPPGGRFGEFIAKLFQKDPGVEARRDLRRFKQLMETGEISTTKSPGAAPRA